MILLSLILILIGLAYFAVPLWLWAGALALLALCAKSWSIALLAGVCAAFNVGVIRRKFLSNPLFALVKKALPPLSNTEKEAIDAGTIWWDSELFNGQPNWQLLLDYPTSTLTAEEEAFINNEVNEICALINDWEIVHHHRCIPEEVWQKICQHGFLGMIIDKSYGGLGFSNYAHAKIVGKIATRCGAAATQVMVPNSLGPAELLQHYGTQEQKDYYLPRLAKGIDIPCFALTSPYAGSDASAIPDTGIITYGSYTDPRDGSYHENVLGIELSLEKRWITLAPIASLFGVAFKLYDPEQLLGKTHNIGITCALIPKGMAGLSHQRRHYPNNTPFMNGTVCAEKLFIPVSWIIGGEQYAGKGWQMLMACLSVGRCISLPALSVAAGKTASYTSAAWAGIRHQFGQAIGRFEGVDEALARIGGYTYQIEAAQDLALSALDNGEKPAVISAILKYHCTERMRKIINDAMDIHGGRAVVTGPRNYLASGYNAIPIAITVEGANILTRSLIIYGQGAYRCHRYLFQEIQSIEQNRPDVFDKALSQHLQQSLRNQARSFVLGIYNASRAPTKATHSLSRYYQYINRLSAVFAANSDILLASLGAKLKFREKLSARMGDALSNLYLASAVLKRFEQQGCLSEDLPLAQYALEQALYECEQAIEDMQKNLANRWVRYYLRILSFPLGRKHNAPSDKLGSEVAGRMMAFDGTLKRLTQYLYLPPENTPVDTLTEPLAVLEPALKAIQKSREAEKILRKAQRDGQLTALTPDKQLTEALDKGLITQTQAEEIDIARQLMRIAITVDDFDMELKDSNPNPFFPAIYLA